MNKPAAIPRWRRQVTVLVAIALVLYWPLAFLATHIPAKDLPRSDLPLDKLFHFGSFGLISFLLTGGLALWRGWIWKWVPVAIAVSAAYGVVDELTQIPFGRQADVRDWVADVLGAIAGAVVAGIACEVVHRRRRLG